MNKFKAFLVIVLLVIVGLLITPPIKNAKFKRELKKETKVEYIDEERLLKEQEEIQKATPSDIEGLSLYDKRMKGLSMNDGDDTDGDGLTDKEEIEVYGSDPLKISTAGDMYSDGEKVKMGADVSTPISSYFPEYEDFRHAEMFSDEVYPNPEDIDDVFEKNAIIVRKDNTELEKANRLDAYAIYEMRYFGGAVAIDLSKVVPDVLPKDIKVWYFADFDEKGQPVSISVLDNMLAIDTREHGDGFYVIANKKKLSLVEGSKKLSAIKEWFELLKKDTEKKVEDAIYNSPDGNVKFVGGQWQVINQIFRKMPTIYYVSSGDEGYDKEYLKKALSFCDDVIGDDYLGGHYITRANTKRITYTEYLTKIAIWKKAREAVPKLVHDYDQYLADDMECIFAWCFLSDEDYGKFSGIDGKEEFSEYYKYFSLNEALPFQNFGSYISPGGNCAGIAMFTATLHNTGTFPFKGDKLIESHYNLDNGSEYSDDALNYEVTYNLNSDEDNKTLMDRYLSDYKDRDFVNRNRMKIPKRDYDGNIIYDKDGNMKTTYILDFDKLSEGEKDFVNMIGMYWKKTVSVDRRLLYFDNVGVYEYAYKEYIPLDVIDRIKKEVNDGKVLYLSLMGHDKDGKVVAHAVNIVDYSLYVFSSKDYEIYTGETKHSREDINLLVYDNNYPDEIREIHVRNKISYNGVSYAEIYYEFYEGADTREISNMTYDFTVMDENMEPYEFDPVVDIYSANYSYDDKIQGYNFDEHLEDYLSKYPSRKYLKNKQKYNEYQKQGYKDQGDGNFILE